MYKGETNHMKKLQKLLAVFLAVFLLSGCFKYRIELTVDKEGNIDAKTTMLFKELSLTESGVDPDEFVDEQIQTSQAEDEDVKYEKVREEIDGESYVGFSITGDEAIDLETKVENNVITLEIPLKEEATEVTDIIGGEEDEDIDYGELGIEMLVIVNMPAKAESNVGTVDGNKVTINLLEDSKTVDTAVITCKLPGSYTVVFVIGAIVLAALAVFLYMKKGKKPAAPAPAPEAAPASAEPVFEPETAAAAPEAEKAVVEEAAVVESEKTAVEETAEPAVTEEPAPAEEASVEPEPVPAETAEPEKTPVEPAPAAEEPVMEAPAPEVDSVPAETETAAVEEPAPEVVPEAEPAVAENVETEPVAEVKEETLSEAATEPASETEEAEKKKPAPAETADAPEEGSTDDPEA